MNGMKSDVEWDDKCLMLSLPNFCIVSFYNCRFMEYHFIQKSKKSRQTDHQHILNKIAAQKVVPVEQSSISFEGAPEASQN